MNSTLDYFGKWAKKSPNQIRPASDKRAVIYTRVSSKEQFDKNLSLDWQKKTIEEFANRNTFEVLECFGGTFESAKTDGRKEFQRMLEFIKKRKGKVSHILVYLLDRFSRTGGGAIKLAKDLREKYGVTIIAVTQPIDTSNPGGVFQQNMQFLFSEYDNQLRRQRAMAGIKEKLERGIWCIKPPMGYDIIRTNGERKIIVNAAGKKLKRAFEWKAQGMKNDEILKRLNALGVKIYKQKLSMIFSNPFYCGIISNRMLDGKLIEGKHEKMISHELFLQVNRIRADAKGKYGVTHEKERKDIPLKAFVKCNKCGRPYTGFIVKAKGLYYYKCQTIGCCCNKRAEQLNNLFADYLTTYSIKPHLLAPLADELNYIFKRHNESQFEQETILKANLAEVQNKIDTIEEKYYINGEMPRDTYDKLSSKLFEQKKEILETLGNSTEGESNLKKCFHALMSVAPKLSTGWVSREISTKEKLQKVVFPKGIIFNFQNQTFQTISVNEAFEAIEGVNSVSGDDKQKQDGIKTVLSKYVGWTGFEPATTCTPYKCATGLRHHPKSCQIIRDLPGCKCKP
jgi:site-specific DNA recombinase